MNVLESNLELTEDESWPEGVIYPWACLLNWKVLNWAQSNKSKSKREFCAFWYDFISGQFFATNTITKKSNKKLYCYPLLYLQKKDKKIVKVNFFGIGEYRHFSRSGGLCSDLLGIRRESPKMAVHLVQQLFQADSDVLRYLRISSGSIDWENPVLEPQMCLNLWTKKLGRNIISCQQQ